MTIRSSGPLTMAEIKAELASTSNRLGDYFAAAGMGPPHSMSRFYGYSSGFRFSLALSTAISAFDLRAWLLANTGWNGVQQVGGTLVVNAGVIVSNGLRIADLPAGSVVDLVLYGIMEGTPGRGGKGGYSGTGTGGQSTEGPAPGGPGGPALTVRNTVRLRDLAGSAIRGGGGGGGGGAGGRMMQGSTLFDGGGGGGQGTPGGQGGAAWNPLGYGRDGTAGSPSARGTGGWPGICGGHGGVSGGWGQPGASGDPTPSYPGFIPVVYGPGAPGGPPGPAVDGWAWVQHVEHAGTFAGALV